MIRGVVESSTTVERLVGLGAVVLYEAVTPCPPSGKRVNI